MNAPKLQCKSAADLRRVVDWLVASGIACTWTQCDLTIRLGVTGDTTLSMLKSAPKLLAACKHALDTFGGVRPEEYAAASRKEFDMLSAAIASAEKGQA